jgi:hypothetical protein
MHHCLQLWAFTCYHAPLCIIIMSQDTVLDQRQILGHISGYFLILYAFRKVRTQLVRLRNWTMLNPTCFFFSAWRLWCSSSWHAGELKTCRVESEPLTLRKYQAKLCQAQLESFSQYLRSIQKPLGKSRYQKTAKEVGPIITSNNNMSYAFICYDINYIYILYVLLFLLTQQPWRNPRHYQIHKAVKVQAILLGVPCSRALGPRWPSSGKCFLGQISPS